MSDPLSALTSVTPADWTAMLGFLGTGGANSVASQFIKHFRAPKWLHPVAMSRFIVVILCLLTAASQYILTNGGNNLTSQRVVTLIAEHFAFLLTFAHFWYWVGVNPAYKYLLGILEDASKWRAATAPQSTANAAGVVQNGQIEV